jgi:hypothetical protein
MEQAFGKRLGRLLESKLDLGERPIAIHAYPEFEYLEPGFATSNLHINMIESTRHLGTLSATLRLRRVHGVPQALQHFGPWPEGQHDRIGSPSAGSLRTHVSLAIDAAAVLVDRISTDEPAAINGSWLSFQEEYLWLLAKMVSRNLSMEREADWPSFAPAEGQRALPH